MSEAMLRRLRALWRLFRLVLDEARRDGAKAVLARAKRGAHPPVSLPPAPKPPSGAHFDVIYAIGYWHGEPKRYRVLNMAEGLRARGYGVHIMPYDAVADIRRNRWRATALVLFRAEYDPLAGIASVLAYAKNCGMRVVYDIDDLVFDPALADRIDGLRLLSPYARRRFLAAMARQRRLLLACERATVTTAALARAVEHLGRPAFVVPNSINAEQLRIAAEMAQAKRPADGSLRIGYFSGTRTHQRDFAECEAALIDIMERHPQAIFRLVGHLDLGTGWRRFGSRIERIGLLSPGEMLRRLAEVDINLAPLEFGNPFCEAKSELKFFEAGLVGVPTVASATETFRAAIDDGVSGFLAQDNAAWCRALESLATSPALRRAMGEAARQKTLARYGLGAVTERAIDALGLRPSPAGP